ncbi:integrase [Pandoraea eparura]|uniref:Integrase n=2 Tax=Pandoraea eparura TaxID=2508291 RepID=A0A5E4S499_9BURK|nr:integrase [Pandoraea eparura]
MGQRVRISLGRYPALSLREARQLRDETLSVVARSINPRTGRKQKRQADKLAGEKIFMTVYEQWMGNRHLTLEEGRQRSLEQIRRVFNKNAFSYLKRLAIYEVIRPHLL